jgi:hypothetical protein
MIELRSTTPDVIFYFRPDEEVWVFINSTDAVPVRAIELVGKGPFYVTCPDQHQGDRFYITVDGARDRP